MDSANGPFPFTGHSSRCCHRNVAQKLQGNLIEREICAPFSVGSSKEGRGQRPEGKRKKKVQASARMEAKVVPRMSTSIKSVQNSVREML